MQTTYFNSGDEVMCSNESGTQIFNGRLMSSIETGRDCRLLIQSITENVHYIATIPEIVDIFKCNEKSILAYTKNDSFFISRKEIK